MYLFRSDVNICIPVTALIPLSLSANYSGAKTPSAPVKGTFTSSSEVRGHGWECRRQLGDIFGDIELSPLPTTSLLGKLRGLRNRSCVQTSTSRTQTNK
ncbi:unnamed protein product [Danaus chrysippus]|uniref:(African queen) hypothetical protein n=1 Tax=Danaus chrysippus TaxID=151541 RepID=A0A8J2R0A0_9NEOP|nr:unnamed protein product [Danaus chrysippus]